MFAGHVKRASVELKPVETPGTIKEPKPFVSLFSVHESVRASDGNIYVAGSVY
jgi:hypothetical protein